MTIDGNIYPVWGLYVLCFLAVTGMFAILWQVIEGIQSLKDRFGPGCDDDQGFADGDDDLDEPADPFWEPYDDRVPFDEAETILGLPAERSWDDIAGWPEPEPVPEPAWRQELYHGHRTLDEVVESMWTRAQAMELEQRLTGPQAKRARQKANRAAKREQVNA